jgi:hypothetical protein
MALSLKLKPAPPEFDAEQLVNVIYNRVVKKPDLQKTQLLNIVVDGVTAVFDATYANPVKITLLLKFKLEVA